MLSGVHRMRESEDFRIAMREGRRAGNPHLVVHLAAPPVVPSAQAVESSPDSGSRVSPPTRPALVGFAVSRQVGSAVVRNRVKRRLRHLVRERLDSLDAGTRMVVRALPASAEASGTELGRSLDAALARARRAGGPARGARASARNGSRERASQ